jgi:hypothetical protein
MTDIGMTLKRMFSCVGQSQGPNIPKTEEARAGSRHMLSHHCTSEGHHHRLKLRICDLLLVLLFPSGNRSKCAASDPLSLHYPQDAYLDDVFHVQRQKAFFQLHFSRPHNLRNSLNKGKPSSINHENN